MPSVLFSKRKLPSGKEIGPSGSRIKCDFNSNRVDKLDDLAVSRKTECV